jgi:VWFA-related protein
MTNGRTKIKKFGQRTGCWLVGGILLAQNSRDLVLHVEVNLVQVDAEVTDGNGRPVTDLTAADFEIRQDGRPQTIANFSYIDTTGGAGVAPRAQRVKDAPPLPPVDLQPGDVRRTFVVVVDDLGVAWDNLPAIKHALRKFVEEEKQPTDLVAILATGGGMGIFQQFATDPKQLLAAVDHLKSNLIFNRVGVSSFPSINPMRMPPNPIRGYVSRQQSAMSIGSILRALRDMPGRKIMLLFSEELSMIQGDNYVQDLGDRAIRSSVAIYTVDPRGLPTLQLTAADNTRGLAPQQISQIPMNRSAYYFQSQAGLSYLAQQTGGLFFHDDNDIDGAVAKVAIESSGYYLIGYQPDASTFGGANKLRFFHKLTVRVKRKGLHVRSRAGFYNRPEQPRDPSRIALASKTREGQIDSAFDSPFASNSIHLRLAGLFVEVPKQGSWIKGLLHVDTGDLRFTEGAGTHDAAVEVVSMLAGGELAKPEFVSDTVKMRLGPATYQAAMKNGIDFTIFRQARRPGPYQLKVVVRDSNSQEIGSASQFVEVPDLGRKALALSGIIMSGENQKTSDSAPLPPAAQVTDYDPGSGPAVRIFPRGSKVLYAYQILNAKANQQNLPELDLGMRLFRDGKQVYSRVPIPFDPKGQSEITHLGVEHRLTLGADLPPGEYVLQVVVTDKLAPKKTATVSQSTDFQIRP